MRDGIGRGPLSGPSREDIASFQRFVGAFSKSDFSPGTWHHAEEVEPGLYAVGWWEASRIVAEWERAIYDRHVIDPNSHYMSQEFGERMSRYRTDPSVLGEADLVTIRTVLTYIVRGERFCSGHIESMFESGVAQAATRRLSNLDPSGPKGGSGEPGRL